MDKISIIVPVHNSESYLNRCVNSLINQTYSNLEIILVDDYSTDSSKKICEEYEKKDSRVISIITDNNGVSGTRNTGIKRSTGEYICFLDSDDEYEMAFVEKMLNEINQSKSELVVCGYKEVKKNLEKEKKYDIGRVDVIQYLNCYTIIDNFEHFANYPWNKMYRANIIRENEVLFDETITVSEDAVFNMQYLKYVKNVSIITDILVRHHIIEGSLVTKIIDKDIQKYTIFEIYNAYKKNYEIRMKEETNKDVIGQYLLYSCLRLCNIYEGEEVKEFIREIQDNEYRKFIKKARCINLNYKIFKGLYTVKMNNLLEKFCWIKRRRNK